MMLHAEFTLLAVSNACMYKFLLPAKARKLTLKFTVRLLPAAVTDDVAPLSTHWYSTVSPPSQV